MAAFRIGELAQASAIRRAAAQLSAPPICHTRKDAPPATAKINSYENDRVVVEADVPPGGGWLVLNDVWHPWWFARVDGVEAPILRANVLFRAVSVPAGSHVLTFEFKPISSAIAELGDRVLEPSQ
jgi:hypothetical protein